MLWPTVHEKSLATTVHHSFNFRIPDSPQVISQFAFNKKHEKRRGERGLIIINPCAPFVQKCYPNRDNWDESENAQSLYSSLKLLLQSEIRNTWVFDLELLSLFPDLTVALLYFKLQRSDRHVFQFTCNPKQAAWLNLPSLGNRSR